MKNLGLAKWILLVAFSAVFLSAKSPQNPNKYFFVFHLFKNAQKLKVQGYGYIMEVTSERKIKVIGKYGITYGIAGYGKRARGDRKSPIGKYKVRRIVRVWTDKHRYGNWNLSLNFPNNMDKKSKHSGGGIALHGGRVSPTHGCIRILDGSQKYPKAGYKNIAVFAKYGEVGTTAFICHSIPRALLGNPGTYLSFRASKYWLEMLKYQYTEGGLVKRMKSF